MGWSSFKVDFGAIIRNFVEAYPYDPFEILVIESIANALDAHSPKVSIRLHRRGQRPVYVVEDYGSGMTKAEFEKNYHALAISSKTKGEGIGFAGIGAKLYLVFLEGDDTILTKTRKGGNALSSEARLVKGELKWKYVREPALAHDGTLYEVPISSEHTDFATEENLIEIVQRHFNPLLLGLANNDCRILVNNKPVPPFQPPVVQKKNIEFGVSGSAYKGSFWQTKEDTGRQPGIEISVFGKTIQTDWFGLDYLVKNQLRQRITGCIVADPLAGLLNTSKTAFRSSSNPSLWANFRRAVYEALKDWLESIDAIERRQRPRFDAESLALRAEVEKALAEALQVPNLIKYNPFMSMRKTRVLISSAEGDVPVGEAEGRQLVAGDREHGPGHGVPAAGLDVGKAPSPSAEVKGKGKQVERKARTGIRINYENRPSDTREAWVTPETLVINEGHPVFAKCKKMGFGAELVNLLRCVFMELIQNRPPETLGEAMDDFRQFFLNWSRGTA